MTDSQPRGLRLWVKLAAFAAVGVVVTHAVHLVVGNRIASRALAREQATLGNGIAQLIAVQAADAILVNDLVTLSFLVDRTREIAEVAYCFVVRDGNILASSFEGGTPTALLRLRAGGEQGPVVVAGADGRMLDLERPILDGKAGVVRLGIDMSILQSTRTQVAVPLGILALAVIAVSLGAAVLIARGLARPIDELVMATDHFDPARPVPAVQPSGGREIAQLADHFNLMMARLTHAREEQEAARQRAVTTERMAALGTLVSGVAHEVNNPLAGVKNCVHALRLADLPEATRSEYLDLMDEGCDRIGEVVGGLLDFARSRPLALSALHASGLADDAVRLVTATLRRRGIVVERITEPGAEQLVVRADRTQASQALVNLLLNAAHVTPDGGRIRIRLRRRELDGGVAVEDHGPGIPPALRSRVLDPFFSTKPEGTGTGLGLSVTRTILEAHEGELGFEFPEAGGTVATVWLPLAGRPASD